MLVYGPSARGALRTLAGRLGAQTLNDLPKPPHLDWAEFSVQVLDAAALSGTPVLFDLTHMEDVAGLLAGVGDYAEKVTSVELRYIQNN